LGVYIYYFSDLKLKKLFFESNNFFNFKSERAMVASFGRAKPNKSGKRLKARARRSRLVSLPIARRSYSSGLNENSNLFNLGGVSYPKLNRLEFSFKPDGALALKTKFLDNNYSPTPIALVRKLRAKNHYSILSRGRRYALISRLSLMNLFTYGRVTQRRVFRSWLKFSIYLERLNYLLILNNEEISAGVRYSSDFLASLYFPLIYNFRNLFFNLLKFLNLVKISGNRHSARNFEFFSVRRRRFNKKFFGILLNFLLFYNKKFSKIPKNFLLNSSLVFYKSGFNGLNFSTLNNFSSLRYIFLGLYKLFLGYIEYLNSGFEPEEKFINDSLIKLSFINFSSGSGFFDFSLGQSILISNIESSKCYLNHRWVPVFGIFKSLRKVSKYARKYRRKPNFSKRRRFIANIQRRNSFLITKGGLFRQQRLFVYPFRSRRLDTNR